MSTRPRTPLDTLYTLVYTIGMVEIARSERFIDWLNGLRDGVARTRIAARLLRVELTGNLGDYHGVGEGVQEFRFVFGPGYRVYFIFASANSIVVLNGGDHDSQDGDIRIAKQEAQLWRE